MINKEKQNNYKILYGKLKDALSKCFYFEAIMIEYSIIEDRLCSILFHSNINKNIYNTKTMLGTKLNSLESQIKKKNNIIAKCVSPSLIKEIETWKKDRNILVHKACTSYDYVKMERCANRGEERGRKLDNCASKIKREMDKQNNK